MKKVSSFFLTALLVFQLQATASDFYYTFNFDLDDNTQVIVEIPEEWETFEDENRRAGYDIEIQNLTGTIAKINVEALLQTPNSYKEILSRELSDYQTILYGRKDIRNSTFSSTNDLVWHTFTRYSNPDEPLYVCIACFHIDNYIISIAVESTDSDDYLFDDANLLIQNVFVTSRDLE